MNLRRWLPIVAFSALGAGAIACATEDLNPQPLPPAQGDDDDSDPTKSPNETSSGQTSNGSISSSGGSSSGFGAPPDAADGGSDADAGSRDP